MMDPVDIVLRASLVVITALAASAALRHRSAGLRHWVLAAGIFAAASVVPMSLVLPAWDLPIEPPRAIEFAGQISADPATVLRQPSDVTASGDVTASAQTARLPVAQFVTVVWGAGFAINLALMLAGLRRVARLTARAIPITDPRWLDLYRGLGRRLKVRGVSLFRTDAPGMVGTWGVWRPCVLMPAHCDTWSDARIRVVLSHELAHIRRADWGIQVAAEMVRAVFWFNPLFWIACSRLRRESEQACDNAVLEAGVPPSEYASHLLAIARTCRPLPVSWATVVPMARPSTLEWRITAMLNTTIARSRPAPRTLALTCAWLLAVTIPIATFQAGAQIGPFPLVGSVYDTTGAVLPGVALTLQDEAGIKREVTTDSTGRFEFEPVVPGHYVLTSSIPGFSSLKQDVTLKDARNWERAITLQVGTIQERITVREQRPAGGAAPATVAAAPIRVGGNIRAPRKLVDVRPIYPEAMRDGGFEGVVPLEVQIGVDGRVTSVRLNSSTQVHPELVNAAIDAVRQWEFSPTLLNGAAIEVFMNATVQFSLPD